MSVQVKRRRDTATNVAAYTGPQGEIVVDTTNSRIVLQDGATAGGVAAAKLSEACLNTATSNTIAQGAHGSVIESVILEQTVTLSSGTTVTAPTQIPAGSLVLGVGMRVLTAITGPTSFEIGVAGTLNQFGSGLPLTAGSVNQGMIGPDPFYSATSLVITAAGGSFTGGQIRLSIHYLVIWPPTS